MAEEIQVPRSEVTRLLGLPADASDAAIAAEMEVAMARRKAVEAASAEEQRLRAEDRRLVNAAFNDGRITNDSREKWVRYLASDRAANRVLLASLAPGLRPDERIVIDPELEQIHDRVVGRLGINPAVTSTPAPRTVAASYQPPSASGTPVVDMLGVPIPQVPPPVRISKGTPPEQWTEKQRQDAMLRRLGPRFYPGTERPPKGDVWYQPGPNDVSIYVEGEGWKENPNYLPGS
ncbi:hypothetical protein [Mycobacterium sp. M23085]|uniref:hypothetical protein n=1 Tax=Mycobacterium sp. M23085 TaxID=3378087 RepID=UPI003877CAA9